LCSEHPFRLRLFETVLGWVDEHDDGVVREFVRTHPFVGFRQAMSASRDVGRADGGTAGRGQRRRGNAGR